MVDSTAKLTLMTGEIDVQISLERVELRGKIPDGINRELEKESKGRHYFSSQPKVKKISYCSEHQRDSICIDLEHAVEDGWMDGRT